MKKKISVLVAVSLLVLTFCACGTPSPTETADKFLTALKTQDSETLASVYEGESLDLLDDTEKEENDLLGDDFSDELMDDVSKKILDFDYELSDEEINEETATVKMTINTYNLGSAMSDFMEEYISQAFVKALSGASEEEIEELANTLFAEQIEKVEKDYTGTVTLNLTKSDDGWKVNRIEDDSEVLNALLGGLVDSMEKLSEDFGSDE